MRRLVPQLIEHGKPIQPGIGIDLVPDSFTERWQLEGVLVRNVVRGGPADRAGLEGVRRARGGDLVLGDRIVAVDGEPIRSIDDLVLAFEAAGVGAEVTLRVIRQERERDVEVTLIALD